ncbi:MAG: hypothetical protein H6581_03560 [Bacteroidia bacterium]|nr:hypothetical protein [Bacteroidia bacterium]
MNKALKKIVYALVSVVFTGFGLMAFTVFIIGILSVLSKSLKTARVEGHFDWVKLVGGFGQYIFLLLAALVLLFFGVRYFKKAFPKPSDPQMSGKDSF